MASIFNPPSGTPARKPSTIKQYPDFPEYGGMKAGSTPKSANLSLERRAGTAGGRSPAK